MKSIFPLHLKSSLPRAFSLLPLAGVLVALSSPVQASTASHLYLLDQSLNDVMGGPSLASLGGNITPSGYDFTIGKGLSLSNVLTDTDYTIDLSFSFSDLTTYRRIVSFKAPFSDNGLYTRNPSSSTASNAALNFYLGPGFPGYYVEGAASAFALNTTARVTLTRSVAGTVTGYVNGIEQFQFNDALQQAVFSGPGHIATFFDDESSVEDPSGSASYIRIYDTALTGAEVAALDTPVAAAVPEPETYAMLLAGLGLLGFTARRRRVALPSDRHERQTP